MQMLAKDLFSKDLVLLAVCHGVLPPSRPACAEIHILIDVLTVHVLFLRASYVVVGGLADYLLRSGPGYFILESSGLVSYVP